MKKNIIIVVLLVVAIVAVMAVKNKKNENPAVADNTVEKTSQAVVATPKVDKPLPKLLDLGADKCIPCKMMMPILDELKKTYAGQLNVEFIDVWKNPSAGTKYGIRSIPTQIFYNADGKELFRHEGFFPREDIMAKWKELGVTLVDGKTEKKNTP